MDSFKIAIAGLGTVGVGVIKILQQHADMIAARAGRRIEIVSVTAGHKDKDRGVDLSAYDWADNPLDMVTDSRLDAVVEVIGGADGIAKDLVEQSLKSYKHVVTANKALLAHHGAELSELAERKDQGLRYEAAVAGGIPIIKGLREGIAANHIHSIYGILNGTCNYILTEMQQTGRSFDDVLKDAQDKGYAEADPTFDVDGIDAAHKLSLLSAIAFGVKPDFDAVTTTGIRHITIDDMRFADQFGFKIKLLGVAKMVGDKYYQSVQPCLIKAHGAMGHVDGVYNAVLTKGDYVQDIMMQGQGAGQGPTASAIVADLIDLARGNILPVFGVSASRLVQANWMAHDISESPYYIRLNVRDEPGTLSDITTALKDHAISIKKAVQPESETGNSQIALLTHQAKQEHITQSLAALGLLSSIVGDVVCLKVEDI